MKFITCIPATTKRLNILSSVIGQMSDGIWENSKAMEKYWKNLDFSETPDGRICLEDRIGVTNDVYDFFANKIKKIIQVEIEDGNTRLEWSRTCPAMPRYMHGSVTVGDCYELYELLKGRDTSKRTYATLSDFEITLNYGGTAITVLVEALNEYDAKRKAIDKVVSKMTATVRRV